MNSNFGELGDIFIESDSTPNKLIPIIKSSMQIPNLISYLNDEKNGYKNKINLIHHLIPLFKSNENILAIFIEKGTNNNSPNLFHVLINLYLNKNAHKEDLSKIEELINIILYNIPIPKTAIEYIYQKLSNFFDNNENKENKTFFRCLRILKIFYGSDIPKKSDKHIKNYFYFNGKNSLLNFNVNKNSKNLNSDFPTLECGFTFIFWLYLQKDLLQYFFTYFPSTIIRLININIIGHNIQLILKNINSIVISLDKKEVEKINLTNTKFKFDDWNFICFYMTQEIKGKQGACLKLIINSSEELIKVELKDDFPLYEIIKSINLFENLIGKVSTVLFFSFCIDNKLMELLRNEYKRGFYKNKYLFQFLYSNEKDYFKNVKNYKYCNKFKKENTSSKYLNINSHDQHVKNLMVFFCPFTYNKDYKIVDDIFGNFIGVLNQNDGVITYKNYIKSLDNIGGINNLLPLGELMLLNNKNNLTKESFEEFIQIIKIIFSNNLKSLSEAYSLNYFSTLALFLERLDKNIFNEKILETFLLLGKEELNYSKNNIILYSIENGNEKDNFIRDILLNTKIIEKFDIQTQILLWDKLFFYFKSDYYQIKESFNISKISTLLKFYDENKYSEYCCQYHANLFNYKNNVSIMNPDMNTKISKLFEIIQLYLDKLTHEDEDDINLFKLLCLDFSPCIQQKIIRAYISHFSNENITDDIKLKTAKNLITNNFLDILEYIFSISLIDMKIDLVNLLNIMLQYYSNNSYFSKKIPTEMKDIIAFIGENILPDQLITKKNDKKIQYELLSNYYNKKEYEIKIGELWTLLKSLMFKNNNKKISELDENKGKKYEINEIFINIIINFVSKNVITEYILEFIQIIKDFLKRKDIGNLYILYEKDFLYYWLTKTIFYFNINENTKDTSKKKLYEDIKKNSVELLQELFKKSEGKEKFNRIRYVLYFAYRLKRFLNKNISCINDIEIIIRLLLNIFLENRRMNLNYGRLTLLCYEFIIFFKDNERYLEENPIPNSNKIEISQKFNSRSTLSMSSFAASKTPSISINNSDDDLIEINYDKMIEEKEVIPDCVYDGIYCTEDKNNSDEKIWKDFSIFEKIIKYYSDNFWGFHKLCLNINENSKKKNNDNDLYMRLIREYTENKNYKNMLYEDLSQLLNLNDVINKKSSMNILYITAQLLSIAYSMSHQKKEIDKIEQYITHFIIFCTISSLNINPTEKEYALIQDHLYNILAFMFLLLQRQSSNLYKEIIDKYITPIFSKVYSVLNKKSFFNLFSKKNIFSNSALFKLFEYIDNSKSNLDNRHRRSTTYISNLELGKKIGDENIDIIKDDSRINFSRGFSTVIKLNDENKKNILKQSFQCSLIYYKNQKNKLNPKLSNIKFLYDYNHLIKQEVTLINETKERKRINKSINSLLTSLENNIKKYFNIVLYTDKKRRNNYKSIKKKLFSFCGFWSNKKIFYENPQILKQKKMNFFGQEMTQFLLKPILDIEYELPNFKKYEKKNLFNKKSVSYKINLNIDEILKENNNENIQIIIDKSKKILSKVSINILMINYGININRTKSKMFIRKISL